LIVAKKPESLLGHSPIARGISVGTQLHRQSLGRASWALLIPLGLVVLAFMALSLVITATGTARFAIGMGYSAEVGYAAGAVFDIAKDILLVSLLALRARRAFVFCAIIGFAWIGLVTFSWLATEATVSTAIAAIERNGSWKMEGRNNIRVELEDVEQQLNVLSQPTPPRPSKMLTETLAAEKVPPGVWRDSQECKSIHESKYFQTACTKVLGLRRELASAESYEKLNARARELRQALAATPVVATADPLPEAFAATLGRLVPIEGRAGVALLLTAVIEIMSCFGPATLSKLHEGGGEEAQREEPHREGQSLPPSDGEGEASGMIPAAVESIANLATEKQTRFVPRSSLKPAEARVSARPSLNRDDQSKPPSNVVPLVRLKPREDLREASRTSLEGGTISVMSSHAPEFVQECLKSSTGSSLSAAELRCAYGAKLGLKPVSVKKLGSELTKLGCTRWRSSGRVRYRDLQLAA
jgi:hypothetical protein